jgi:hypothetical protein
MIDTVEKAKAYTLWLWSLPSDTRARLPADAYKRWPAIAEDHKSEFYRAPLPPPKKAPPYDGGKDGFPAGLRPDLNAGRQAENISKHLAQYIPRLPTDAAPQEKSAAPTAPAPAPAPACRRVSDLTVSEHEELLRKNSFWGALGDSLDSAFEFLIRVAAVLIGLAVLGLVAMWLIAHF